MDLNKRKEKNKKNKGCLFKSRMVQAAVCEQILIKIYNGDIDSKHIKKYISKNYLTKAKYSFLSPKEMYARFKSKKG